MEFSSYIVVFTLVVLFAVLLPFLSGIGSFKVSGNAQKTSSSKRPHNLQFKLKGNDDSSGVSSASERSKFEIDSKTGLKKRVVGRVDKDPNSYDYDVDELIKEDELNEQEEQGARFKQFNGNYEGVV